MVMLRFTLQSFQLNLNLNLFQIQTPLQLNQLMIMKWTIYWNYFIKNTMKIFWVLTSICFRLDCWSPLLQNCIQSILCCFINMEEQMLHSQVSYHTFLCFSQTRPLQKWLMETRYMTKELGFLYFAFLTVPLYIQWYQFIIVQVTLTTPSHQIPSNFTMDFKRLHLNLLNIVTLLTLRVVLGYHPTRLKTILTIFKSKLSNSTFTKTGILLSQLYMNLKKSFSDYSSAFCSCLYYHTKPNGRKRTHGMSTIKYPQIRRTLPYLSLYQGN